MKSKRRHGCVERGFGVASGTVAAVKCVAADLRPRISNSRLDLMEITCQS